MVLISMGTPPTYIHTYTHTTDIKLEDMKRRKKLTIHLPPNDLFPPIHINKPPHSHTYKFLPPDCLCKCQEKKCNPKNKISLKVSLNNSSCARSFVPRLHRSYNEFKLHFTDSLLLPSVTASEQGQKTKTS